MNMRKILLGGLLATAAIGGIAACSSGADHQTAGTQAPVVQPSAAQPAKPTQPSAAQPAKPAPQYTTAQENAIGSAQDYLAMSGFSRAGLINGMAPSCRTWLNTPLCGRRLPRCVVISAIRCAGPGYRRIAIRHAHTLL
jgi:hypothetical protein